MSCGCTENGGPSDFAPNLVLIFRSSIFSQHCRASAAILARTELMYIEGKSLRAPQTVGWQMSDPHPLGQTAASN